MSDAHSFLSNVEPCSKIVAPLAMPMKDTGLLVVYTKRRHMKQLFIMFNKCCISHSGITVTLIFVMYTSP